jgi:uncharacterized membrane protein
MALLVLGLVIFLGVHSVRIVADGYRSAFIARRGLGAWKGLYSIASLVGFVLIVWGYGQARQQPVVLWPPSGGAYHLGVLLTLLSFILLAAKDVPGNGIKARLHHPMVLGVKVWAFAHLLANHTLADLVLFGSFLVWSIASFAAARRRDRAAGTVYPPGRLSRTLLTVGVGVALWLVFALWLHGWLIGVRPFG